MIDSILSSADPDENSYDCFGFSVPVTAGNLYEPSVVRRAFHTRSLTVHPDKNSHPLATQAFQKLSQAFEILYDLTSQTKHWEQIISASVQVQTQPPAAAAAAAAKKKHDRNHRPEKTNKKRKPDWKEKQKAKKKQKKYDNYWSQQRSWEDVVKELRRREELERQFLARKRGERLEKRIQGMIWKAMKICRNLDEQAGCPPTFVNGLWAPLYEQEVLRTHGKNMPEGWELLRWEQQPSPNNNPLEKEPPNKRMYRYIPTGEESEHHPIPKVEQLLEKGRKALATNQYRFHTEPRLFLDEILEYLKEDHDYTDMDDDLLELQEQEES